MEIDKEKTRKGSNFNRSILNENCITIDKFGLCVYVYLQKGKLD
jgi:hypothetical protein